MTNQRLPKGNSAASPVTNSTRLTLPDRPSPESILIVDDNPANLRLLSEMLKEQGYRVRVANGGLRAINAVQANRPDLILLDILMPDMDGYEVCTRLMADERSSKIPIIFLSALDSVEDKVKAFTTGGVDYITKPFQSAEVLARVETHLKLHRLQQKLEEANRELDKQVQELDAFAHTVAHDLKSPLAIIMGYGALITSDLADTNTLQKGLEAIITTSEKMNNIVEALLLLARVRQIEEITLAPLDMAEIVNGARERLITMIRESHAEIILPNALAWPQALGYAPWVEDVWSNYISNAIQYGGQPPRVELGAETSETMVRFWVRDNGGGLTPQEQVQLFAPFERLGYTRVKGHGLGLSIAKRIVEKLGGQVGVESVLGQGSTFYFRLPRSPHHLP
jgi:signal transduction histidine kinase